MTSEDLIIYPVVGTLDGVTAAYSSRLGGVSGKPFASLNLGGRTGDDLSAVERNRQHFFAHFGIGLDQLAVAEQVHGSDVALIQTPGFYEGVDGLVTRTPGIALTIAAADCAAVLLADPTARVIGACHAGWRGTVGRVVDRTLELMATAGASAERTYAFVGPCISDQRFEVGEEVAAQFDARFVIRRPAPARPHVDLKAALVHQLTSAGVGAASVEVSPFCTYERTDLFYSYRAESGTTGRMMGFIMLSG